MPELPEVETVKRQLEKVLVGTSQKLKHSGRAGKIKKVKVLLKKSFIGKVSKIEESEIVGVGRRAKIMVIRLSNGLSLLIHLKMTGQLVYVPEKDTSIVSNSSRLIESNRNDTADLNSVSTVSRIAGGHPTSDWVEKLPSKHTRVVIELSKGTLYFNDMRTFGWIKVVDEEEKRQEWSKYGPDVNSRQFTLKHFKKVLESSRRAVKLIILDQRKIAGLGNIYANDGLFCAGVDPRVSGVELVKDKEKTEKLFGCLKKVINKGIRLGGASERDFVHADGLGGSYQKHYLVYGREGKKCKRCQGIIEKIKIGGRGSYFCPKCQVEDEAD